MAKSLTHIGKRGEARMVDVSAKAATARVAVAEGRVMMARATLDLVLKGNAKKGDVLGAARLAGIMAAKRTHELIPLCHPLALTKVEVDIAPDKKRPGLIVRATCKLKGQTGVEIGYTIPKEGAQMFFDNLAIPSDAKNVTEAYELINYLYRPDVAAKNSDFLSYANGNLASQKLVDPKILKDKNIYPDDGG